MNCFRWSSWYRKAVVFAVFAGVGLGVSASLLAQSDAPSGALISSQVIVFNAASHKAYGIDQRHNAVWIANDINGSTKNVAVGSGPDAIAANGVTGRVYVANSGGGTVSVIDGQSDAVVATVKLGMQHPYVLTVNERTNKVYVAGTYTDLVVVIDGATNEVSSVRVGSGDAIAADSARDKVYLLGYENGNITVLDGRNGSLSKVPAGGMHLWGLALDEDAGML